MKNLALALTPSALIVTRLATVAVLLAGLLSSPAQAERRPRAAIPVAKCKEFSASLFKPCICSKKVPKGIKFRPSLTECNGRAAAVLSRDYASSYSVVLRDNQNRDRFPPSGYNNCSAAETELGLNKCSAFKCQKVIRTRKSSIQTGPQQICCFGDAGTSSVLKGATRLTIKLRDIPGSNLDPLVRVCLNGFSPRKKLN